MVFYFSLFNSKKGAWTRMKKKLKRLVTKIYDIFFLRIGNFAIDC